MKVSYKWLKEFVDIPWNARELAGRLEMTGTAVESITEIVADFSGVVTGVIKSVEAHPQADKLSVTTVDAGTGEDLTIVCGAKNISPGQKVPVALIGAVLPGDFKIKKAALRGVESFGMLCSETELKLGEDARGIMILDEDTAVGLPLAETLGIEDTVIEFEITPNRPDCMSMMGIAREVAALTGGTVRRPPAAVKAKPGDSGVTVEIADPDLCPRYTARVVRGTVIAPSPYLMRARLSKAGIRPINNLVDITNYVLLETGQPLHAFDKDKIGGNKIIVRRAAKGEKMTTLDGVERILTADMLVIADAKTPSALAGIMGGGDSEIGEGTTNCLIESAYFNPAGIFRTSSALDLRSEASARFERGTDPEGTEYAAERAAFLMAELAGAEAIGAVIDAYPEPVKPINIEFDPERAKTLIGADISLERITSALTSVEVKVKPGKNGVLNATAPTFRPDLNREIDLIEEVARIFGFENVPSTVPDSKGSAMPLTAEQTAMRAARDLMVSAGLQECVTYAFIDPAEVAALLLPDGDSRKNTVSVANPLGENQSVMRPSLLPGLLKALRFNAGYGQEDAQLFELGRIFVPAKRKPDERNVVACVLRGSWEGDAWYGKRRAIDFFDIKGIVEALVTSLAVAGASFTASDDPLYHPGQRGALTANGKPTGSFGLIHPYVAEGFDLKGEIFAFELDMAVLAAAVLPGMKVVSPSKYPAVVRDVSMLIDAKTPFETVLKTIHETTGALMEDAYPFDLYAGEHVPEGMKSLAVRLIYRSGDRTLTVEEVDSLHEKALAALTGKLGARLR